MSISSIRIGIVQENPVVGDIQGNTDLVIRSIKDFGKKRPPDIVVFSEMFLTGYPPEDLLYREDLLKAVNQNLEEISKAYKDIHIVIGYPRLKKGKLFNAAGVIYQGSIQHEYFLVEH